MVKPEALAMLRIARRDLQAAQLLQDKAIDEAIWLFHLGEDPPLIHNLTALLERIDRAGGAAAEAFRSLEAFTIFAVQFRYDADPEPMGLERSHWLRRAEQLVEYVASLLGAEA